MYLCTLTSYTYGFTDLKDQPFKIKGPAVVNFWATWCAPCIKLDREIWSTDAFKKYANENYVMLKADFPRKKKNTLSETQTKANGLLAEKYNKQGFFPFVVILDSNGKVLGESSYKKTTPENYIKELNVFTK